MQNSIETRGNFCTELGAPVFQAISNLINGKKSVVERPKRGGLSLPGNSYKNLHNPCMYLVDILKFPKKSHRKSHNKNQIFLRSFLF